MRRLGPFLCIASALAGCVGPPPVNGTSPPAVASSVAPYDIVALGASNTAGRGRGRTADGVPPDRAYPAQLERLLASGDVLSAF